MSYGARTKYDEPGRAARYRARSPKRDAEEWRLIQRLLARIDGTPRSALDVPCGTGRVADRLIDAGIPTRAADLSPAMREACEERLGGRQGFLGVVPIDLEAAEPDPGLRADLVVCFRFFHHLPDEATRARVLRGLRALTGRDLLLSFHHPVSAHQLDRLVRRALTGRKGDRYVVRPGRLEALALDAGLRLVETAALGAWRRELWLARLQPVGRSAS